MADHKQFRLLAMSKNLVRILKYRSYVTKGDNVLHVRVTTVSLDVEESLSLIKADYNCI